MSFTAIADCPKCGDIGVHWLDEPMGPPSIEEWQKYYCELDRYRASIIAEIVDWTGNVVRRARSLPEPYPPRDESNFEVVRICKECGHRWGQ